MTGVGVALETAACGLETALVEANDFAAGTSSKSFKLVHGGLRDLQPRRRVHLRRRHRRRCPPRSDLARTAAAQGAVVAKRCRVTGFEHDRSGRVTAATVDAGPGRTLSLKAGGQRNRAWGLTRWSRWRRVVPKDDRPTRLSSTTTGWRELPDRVGFRRSGTRSLPLLGGADFVEAAPGRLDAHLADRDGDSAVRSSSSSPRTPIGRPLIPGSPYLRAEAIHALRCESATALAEVLTRRTRCTCSTVRRRLAAAPAVADLFPGELIWDDAEREVRSRVPELLESAHAGPVTIR